jgi:hypothetical protein
VAESTSEQPEEPGRPDVARVVAAGVRQSGEKKGPSSYLVPAGLAIALAAAIALGVGAVVFHHKDPAKPVNAADRQRPPASNAPAVVGAPTPVPSRSTGPKQALPHGKNANGAAPAKKSKSGAKSGVRAASTPTHLIISYASNRCIDADSGGTVQIWDCAGGPNQRWALVNGTIREHDRCMTASGSSKGASITVATCDGRSTQQFTLNAAHDLANGPLECVDVKDQKTGNGTPLQLWDCAGTSNQKWHTG